MKFFLYLLITLLWQYSFASENQYYDKISRMINKNYQIMVFKGSDIHLLLGNAESRRLTYKQLIESNHFYSRSKVNIRGVGKEIADFTKKGYKVLIRKGTKFFILENDKFKKFDAKKNKSVFNVKEKNKFTFPPEWYSWRLASSFIQLQDMGQFSFEVGWLPRFRITKNTQLRLAFSLAPLSLEDQALEQKVGLGAKSEIYLRQYWRKYFLELGGGYHYLDEYSDTSVVGSFAIGKALNKDYWIIENKFGARGFYLQASQINWINPITELKLGVELSF